MTRLDEPDFWRKIGDYVICTLSLKGHYFVQRFDVYRVSQKSTLKTKALIQYWVLFSATRSTSANIVGVNLSVGVPNRTGILEAVLYVIFGLGSELV